MDLTLAIQIALFIPFLLTLLVFGATYLTAGYKRDLGQALVSLIATVLSVVLSLLLAQGIAWAVSEPIVSALPADLTSALSELGTIGTTVVKGVIEVVLSFLLFGLFFTISLAVFKILGKKLHLKVLDKISTGKAGTRIAGLGIRGIDALIVTIMFLLPLYGTIATVAPTVASVVNLSMNSAFLGQENNEMNYGSDYNQPSYDEYFDDFDQQPFVEGDGSLLSPQSYSPKQGYSFANTSTLGVVNNGQPAFDENELVGIINGVAEHPVLIAYKNGPGAWVYSSLSSFSINGNTVDFASAANSISGLLDKIEICVMAYETGDENEILASVEELIEYAKNDVINQRWSYEMFLAFVSEADSLVYSIDTDLAEDEQFVALFNELESILLSMTYEDYTKNVEGALGLVEWCVEKLGEFVNKEPSEEEIKEAEAELTVQIGKILNMSEQAVSVKKIVLQIYAEMMYSYLPDSSDPAYEDFHASRKDAPASAEEFIDKYFGDGYLKGEDQAKEASVIFALFNDTSIYRIAEAFARHPSFGADAVIEAMGNELFCYSDIQDFGYQLSMRDDKEEICKELTKIFKECENKSYDEMYTLEMDIYTYIDENTDMETLYEIVNSYSVESYNPGNYASAYSGDGNSFAVEVSV